MIDKSITISRCTDDATLTIEADATGLSVRIYENDLSGKTRRSRIHFEGSEAANRFLFWLEAMRFPLMDALGHDVEAIHLSLPAGPETND